MDVLRVRWPSPDAAPPRGSKASLKQRFLSRFLVVGALAATSAILGGCGGYVSEYVPPPDGLPRPVAMGDSVSSVIGTPVPAQCDEEVAKVVGGSAELPSGPPRVTVWSPTVVVVHAGGPRHVHAPGAIGRPTTVVHSHGGGGSGASVRTHGAGSSGRSGSGGLSGLGGGGGSSGGGDLGKAVIVVAVAAVLTLPFISLGLAVGRPEPEKEVAAQIDYVNAQRDLARSVGSPCDAVMVQAVEQVSP